MKKLSIICIVALIACLLIGTVSAETYSQSWSSSYYSQSEREYTAGGSSTSGSYVPSLIVFSGDLSAWEGCYYIGYAVYGSDVAGVSETPLSSYDVTVSYGGTTYATGYATISYNYNAEQTAINEFYLMIWFDDFKNQLMIDNGLTSSTRFSITFDNVDWYIKSRSGTISTVSEGGDTNIPLMMIYVPNVYSYVGAHSGWTVLAVSGIEGEWESTLYSDWSDGLLNTIDIYSNIYTDWDIWVENSAYTYNNRLTGSDTLYVNNGPVHVNVTDPYYDDVHQYILGEESESTSGAWNLLVGFEDITTGNYLSGVSYEVKDADTSEVYDSGTISGMQSLTLNRSISYNITGNIAGYHDPDGDMPTWGYFSYTGEADELYVFVLYPDTAENTSYVMFLVYETSSYGGGTISDASVYLSPSGVQRQTGSSGQATFSDLEDGTYSYSISKSGYSTVTGSFTAASSEEIIAVYLPREGAATATVTGAATGTGTAVATADIRSYEEKADSALGILFDNVETVASLAILIVIMSMIKWVGSAGNNPPRRRGRRK